MKKTYGFVHLVLAAFLGSVILFFFLAGAEKVFTASPVFAQGAVSPDLVLYANSRKDTDKWQSYIFFDKKTGDLWVYRDESFKEHYRVTAMGQDLLVVK